MGVVWLARRGEDRVAMKVLRAALAGNDVYVRRFLREARVAAEVRHPLSRADPRGGEAGGTPVSPSLDTGRFASIRSTASNARRFAPPSGTGRPASTPRAARGSGTPPRPTVTRSTLA